jgi:cardiolipin synthase
MDFTHKIYNRFLSNKIIPVLSKFKITPNLITIFNFHFTAIVCSYFIIIKHYYLGLFFIFFSVILDYIDGDLARKTNNISEFGKWIESFGDTLLQTLILASFCISINFKYSIILLVVNNTLQLLSLSYNKEFGFDSYKGSCLFRDNIDKNKTLFNTIIKIIIDPTSNYFSLILFTIRYWLIIGIVLNSINAILLIITFLTIFRFLTMFYIFILYIAGYRKLYFLKVLERLWELTQL